MEGGRLCKVHTALSRHEVLMHVVKRGSDGRTRLRPRAPRHSATPIHRAERPRVAACLSRNSMCELQTGVDQRNKAAKRCRTGVRSSKSIDSNGSSEIVDSMMRRRRCSPHAYRFLSIIRELILA
jgi:hypothetical protein